MMDEESFDAFYRLTAAPLRAYVVRVLGNATQADDIVHDAYLRLLRNPPATRDARELRYFVFRIASNLIADCWRRGRRERGTLDERGLRPTTSGPDVPLKWTWHGCSSSCVRAAPADGLAYVEGADHREIAAAWTCERSVRVLLHRVRRKLAGLLVPSKPRPWRTLMRTRDGYASARPRPEAGALECRCPGAPPARGELWCVPGGARGCGRHARVGPAADRYVVSAEPTTLFWKALVLRRWDAQREAATRMELGDPNADRHRTGGSYRLLVWLLRQTLGTPAGARSLDGNGARQRSVARDDGAGRCAGVACLGEIAMRGASMPYRSWILLAAVVLACDPCSSVLAAARPPASPAEPRSIAPPGRFRGKGHGA